MTSELGSVVAYSGGIESLLDEIELITDDESGVSLLGRHVVLVEAEVVLGAVVGVEPSRAELLGCGIGLGLPVAEHGDEEVALGVEQIRWHPEVDVVDASHRGPPPSSPPRTA